jgi:hypothetical protein
MSIGRGGQRLAAEQARGPGHPGCWVEPGVIAAVAAGSASDGNALATVTYRGADIDAPYLASYTPTAGHNVALLIQSTGSVLILGRVIGTP